MFTFEYKNYGIYEINMYDKYLFEVASITYNIIGSTIYIDNIQKSTYACRKYGNNYHFGTIIFNELLKYIKNNCYCITDIKGTLSFFDAENNWIDSIPFYFNFPNYIDDSLKYKLEFHLFNKDNYTSEILLPIDIEEFIKEHINTKSDASFCYKIL